MTHSNHTATAATVTLFALMALALVGCQADSSDPSDANTRTDGPTRGLAFALTNSSADDTAGDSARLGFSDDSGLTYTLTEARFVLRHIELDLPAGVSCADIRGQLAGGAVCHSDDDRDDDNGGDDNGADDLNDDRNDDNGGDRDGTDDNGTDDLNDDNGGDRSGGSDDSGEDAKVRIDGPFVVDLVAGTTTPSLEGVRLPDIAWRRVDLRVDDAEAGLGAGDPLKGQSWVMRADFEREGQVMALNMALRFNEDIRFEARQGVSVTPGAPLLVGFDVAAWLDGLPIGQCIDDGDLTVEGGVVEASDDSAKGACSGLEGTLKDNLKRSGDLR